MPTRLGWPPPENTCGENTELFHNVCFKKEKKNEGKKGEKMNVKRGPKDMFVASVFASTFYGIADADSVGLATTGEYLRRKYGAFPQCFF
jgi:hypothetical protein